MDPETQPYKVIRAATTNAQHTGEGGAYLIVSALNLRWGQNWSKKQRDSTDSWWDSGACAEKWETACASGQLLLKVLSNGQEQHFTELMRTLSDPRGQLNPPAENVAVLATCGATNDGGSTIGNIYLLQDLVPTFGAQQDDEAIQRRIWRQPRHGWSTNCFLQRVSKTEELSS